MYIKKFTTIQVDNKNCSDIIIIYMQDNEYMSSNILRFFLRHHIPNAFTCHLPICMIYLGPPLKLILDFDSATMYFVNHFKRATVLLPDVYSNA